MSGAAMPQREFDAMRCLVLTSRTWKHRSFSITIFPAAQAQSLEQELMHMLGGPRSVNSATRLRNGIQGIGEATNRNFLELEFAANDELVIEALRRAGLLGR